MRTAMVRWLAMPCAFVLVMMLQAPALAGGVGISEARDSVGTSQPNLPTGESVPFHLYEARLDRSRKARRDFDFLWSDTYKSRLRTPLDSLSGAEQINDLQRLAETVGEVIGANPFGLGWTDIETAYNFLARTEGYRASAYNADPFASIGLRVAQSAYPDQERNHIDAYVYAPSFSAIGQWSSYIGDIKTLNPQAGTSNYGAYPSNFVGSAEDSLTGRPGVLEALHANSVMIPGPRPDGVASTGPTRWTRPSGTANAYLVHESTHAINADGGGSGGYLHMFASGSEVVAGLSTDPPVFDVDYHYTLGPTGDNLGNAYPHWQSFMAYLAFNWRGVDTTTAAWQDDLLPRWARAPAAERSLPGLAMRLRDTECLECANYPGFVGLDSLARVQRLIHDWRVANYVNSPTLQGGRYGFPPQFGFSPANQLGAWQDIDHGADNNVAIPPIVTVGPSGAVRSQRFTVRPAGVGATARPMVMQMFGAEYFIFKADPALATSPEKAVIRVRPPLALKHNGRTGLNGDCSEAPGNDETGRLTVSVINYSGWSDSLFRHPEWATSISTKSVELDEVSGDLRFEIPAFGGATKGALVVVSLGDGPSGALSRTGADFPLLVPLELGIDLEAPGSPLVPRAVAATPAKESEPCWSFDGLKLAYSRLESNGTKRIYTREAVAGATEAPLTTASFWQSEPAWSPRADQLAFVEGDTSTSLRLVNLSSGTATTVTTPIGRVSSPVFSPDGNRLAYIREWALTAGGGPKDPPREGDPMSATIIGLRDDIRIRDFSTGIDTLFARFERSEDDTIGALSVLRWRIDGQALTFSQYLPGADRSHLCQLDVSSKTVTYHDGQAPEADSRELSPGHGPLLLDERPRIPYFVDYDPFSEQFCGRHDGVVFKVPQLISTRDTMAALSTAVGFERGGVFRGGRWSPDGTKVAYSLERGGDADIFVVGVSGNRPPLFWSSVIANHSFTNCGGAFNMGLTATDADGDGLSYRAFGLPSGATLEANNQIVWPEPVVGDHWFTVQALDPKGGVDTRLIHINVYDGGDCGGGGGGEGEGEIIGGHGARRVADSRRLMNPLMASPKAVNSFLDGVEPGAWASQVARLSAAQLDSAGHYIANVVGLRPGEFKLDRARLLVVDHDPSVVPLATQEGVVLGAKRNPATLAAMGSSGARDGLLEAGTLITMAWADSDSVAGVLVDCARAGAVTNEAAWGIAVDVREGEGWREVGVIKPRAGYDALASSLQGAREARLRFLSDVYVREIAGYAWASGLEAASTTSACVSATLPNAADSLAAVDGASLRLARGQSAALAFDAPPPVEGKRRTLFLDYVASFTPGPGGAVQTRASGNGPAGRFALHSTSPNPFERSTQIRFELPQASRVQIEVFDAQGRRVRNVSDRSFEAGVHSLEWDGADTSGRRVGPGVYLVRMRAGGFRAERRVVRLGH